MRGLDRLLLKKCNAKGVFRVFFRVFEVRDRKLGVVNCEQGNQSSLFMLIESAQLTSMNE